MKMIVCCCNISVINELRDILNDEKIDNYQIVDQVTGKCVRGLPRLNTAVWPGMNTLTLCYLEKSAADRLVEAVKRHNASFTSDDEAIMVAGWEIDTWIPG